MQIQTSRLIIRHGYTKQGTGMNVKGGMGVTEDAEKI